MESNKKKLGNKGFSLVELIVVIAIMAILIGIIAPNLIGYIERTNVSADIQLADTIRTAVKTAMMDPAVLSNADGTARVNAFKTSGAAIDLTDLVIEDSSGGAGTDATATIFGKTIAEILGENKPTSINAAWITKQIRSGARVDGDPFNITVEFKENDVIVTLENTNDGNGADIVVP